MSRSAPNREYGREHMYEFQLISTDGEIVEASSSSRSAFQHHVEKRVARAWSDPGRRLVFARARGVEFSSVDRVVDRPVCGDTKGRPDTRFQAESLCRAAL